MILRVNKYGKINITKFTLYANIVCCGLIYSDLSSNLLICPPSELLSAAGVLSPDVLSLPEFPHPAKQETISADASITLTNFFFIVNLLLKSCYCLYRFYRNQNTYFSPAFCTNAVFHFVHYV